MIDSKGRKIEGKQSDPTFVLKEIEYIAKLLDKQKSIKVLPLLVGKLKEYLSKWYGLPQVLLDAVALAETYQPKITDEDLAWEMVYVRRLICDNQKHANSKSRDQADSRYVSASFFDKICELTPTVHNRSVRVNEYLNVAADLIELKDSSYYAEIKEVLNKAKELYEQIEDSDKLIYLKNGYRLYSMMYSNYRIMKLSKEMEFVYIKKLAELGRRVYKETSDHGDLALYARCFSLYSRYQDFSYEDEKEQFDYVIDEVERVLKILDEDPNDLRETLEKLKYTRNKLKSNANT